MPNWPLSYNVRQVISGAALSLAGRTVDLARIGIPLTLVQIQDGAAGLTADQLARLRQLKHEGVTCIEQHADIRVAFLREKFPELRRGVVLRLTLPKRIFVGHATQFGMRSKNFTLDDTSYLVATLETLTSEERAKLLAWLNNLLRQKRILEITRHCVVETLKDARTPTAAHLKAHWPALTTVLSHTCDRHYTQWVERFRNLPTRNEKIYAPTPEWSEKFKDLIAIADMQLAAGQLLSGGVKFPERGIVPVLEHWERIDGDRSF